MQTVPAGIDPFRAMSVGGIWWLRIKAKVASGSRARTECEDRRQRTMRLLLLVYLCAYAAWASDDIEYDDYETVSFIRFDSQCFEVVLLPK